MRTGYASLALFNDAKASRRADLPGIAPTNTLKRRHRHHSRPPSPVPVAPPFFSCTDSYL